MDDKERKYLMTRRQCLIMELGAVEDLLDMERSIVPKHRKEHRWFDEKITSSTITSPDIEIVAIR